MGLVAVFWVRSMLKITCQCCQYSQIHTGGVLDTLGVVGSSPMPPNKAIISKDLQPAEERGLFSLTDRG